MKHRYERGSDRRETETERRRDGGKHAEHHRLTREGGRSGRMFDYGELRLLSLAMIAEKPSYGYELMKSIEERLNGVYSPSPGVIYPTLSWLEDMGYVSAEAPDAGRKRYLITTEGEAFLTANRAAVDALVARVGTGSQGRSKGIPTPIVRGMENLKLALRLRLKSGPVDPPTAETIAAALDAAAQAIDRA